MHLHSPRSFLTHCLLSSRLSLICVEIAEAESSTFFGVATLKR